MGAILQEKVILITGAGNGIGRAHALACARAGARVVVNDLGGSRDGVGEDASAAQKVVDEIVALGGDAVANHDSVTDPDGCARMVGAALERWGRLDAVVNNAGILRDKTFMKLTDAEWDLVVAVHLRGTYNVCRAAIPALQRQGGSIINTTSYSGMIGNFGQSNYAAAKAGIYGLTRVLALELRKSKVTANCVAPIAKTRMTEELGMVEAAWTPEQISPMIVFLASDLARDVTGQVFGVQGQRLHVYEVKVNDGVEKAGAELWTAEEIAAKLDRITSFAPAAAPEAPKDSGPDPVKEVFSFAPAAFLPERAGDFAARIHWKLSDHPGMTLLVKDGVVKVEDGLVGAADCTVKSDKATIVGVFTQTIDPQKAFMQGKMTADNLGVLMKFAMFFDFAKGAKAAGRAAPAPAAPEPVAAPTWPIGKIYDGGAKFAEPAHALAYAAATGDDSVAYLGDAAIVPPMFHVRLFKELMFQVATDPELKLDLLRLVHGEHDATFHRVIRPWDLVQLRAKLEAVEEKSSGLLVVTRMYGFVDGALAVEVRTAYFIRGKKKVEGGEAKAPEPERGEPTYTEIIHVGADQSLRYAAASLDDNPIHTDAATAAAAGLPGVILQGLCTMAMTGAAFVRSVADGDAARLRRLSVRFARPVLNGATLTTRGWSTGAGTYALETRDEAGNLVISNGVAEPR